MDKKYLVTAFLIAGLGLAFYAGRNVPIKEPPKVIGKMMLNIEKNSPECDPGYDYHRVYLQTETFNYLVYKGCIKP